jgi:hypothetical protein
MTRGILFTLMMAVASCSVTAYEPTASQQPQQQSSSGAGTQTSPSPSPAPNPPPPPPTPPPPTPTVDAGMPASTPDLATTTTTAPDCTKLSDCCAQLQDPNAQQMCMDAVKNLDDGVCMAILQQLQGNGLCQ